MNAETLNTIARALRQELDENRSPALLQELLQGLQNMVQQPGQPAPQQQVANTRAEFEQGLADAPSNEFSPA